MATSEETAWRDRAIHAHAALDCSTHGDGGGGGGKRPLAEEEEEEDKRAATSDEDGDAGVGVPCGEEEAFGWMEHIDAATGVACYVHSHTGEVRWPPHDQHQERSMPGVFVSTGCVYEGPWSPWHPQLVMLPTGITPARPHSSRIDSWRGGYARYPMNYASHGILEDSNVPADQAAQILQLEYRVLPCTWEQSVYGPPFLEPFPVLVLRPIMKQDETPSGGYEYVAPEPQASWPSAQTWYTAHASPVFGAAYSNIGPQAYFPGMLTQVQEAHYLPEHIEQSTHFVEKAHNRRGYSIRQARKLMRELGLQPKKPKKAYQANEDETCNPHVSPQDREFKTLVDDLHRMRLSPPAIRAN